ncbi:MAG: glycosyltransferase family 39 protein [Planctomycetes bacterium]|nr:glycosyltransferase family 39 protein [Planctomycetota bacterium]
MLHSDAGQLLQATEFFTKGQLTDGAPYPLLNTYGTIAADFAAYPIGKCFGWWENSGAYFDRLTDRSDPALRHSIARIYTAIFGACIVFATYRLARVCFSRKLAVAAAAIMCFAPAHVIYSHQARIHAPGVVMITFAAVVVAKMLKKDRSLTYVVLAGVSCGIAAAFIQLSLFISFWGGVLLLLGRRTWRDRARHAFLFASTALAVYGILHLATHPAGIVLKPVHESPFSVHTVFGVPDTTFRGGPADYLIRIPEFIFHFAATAPMIAAGTVFSILLFLLGRFRGRNLLIFAGYPAVVFLLLGTTYTSSRYSLSVLPFLSILSMLAFCQIRNVIARVLLLTAAVAVPAALTGRYLNLISGEHTTLILREHLHSFDETGLNVSISDSLLTTRADLPRRVNSFPPGSNFKIWPPFGTETPPGTLERLRPDVFIDDCNPKSAGEIRDKLREMKYKQYGIVKGGIPGEGYLPDVPDYLVPDLWVVTRCGPTFIVWVRNPRAVDALGRLDWPELERTP